MAAPLPPDMAEHSGTLASWLAAAVALVAGAFAMLWRDREKSRESAVASALEGVGSEIREFRTEFTSVITRIFDKIDGIEKHNHERDVRCAALHGKGPSGWDGSERRKEER